MIIVNAIYIYYDVLYIIDSGCTIKMLMYLLKLNYIK